MQQIAQNNAFTWVIIKIESDDKGRKQDVKINLANFLTYFLSNPRQSRGKDKN